ncbi:MAG TPA: hypothetical protein VGL38_08145 [bacterium]|jgi:hypothetical protein
MPTFEVETVERWEYEVQYRVEALTIEDSLQRILAGDVEYDERSLRERSPKLEVHRIIRVTIEDAGEVKVIESERRLNRLLRQRHKKRIGKEVIHENSY